MLTGISISNHPPIYFGNQIRVLRQKGCNAPFDLDCVRRHFLEGDSAVGYVRRVYRLNLCRIRCNSWTYIHIRTAQG